MRVLGTESELVLKSRWVAPGVLEETGFAFAHPRLDEALADIWERRVRRRRVRGLTAGGAS